MQNINLQGGRFKKISPKGLRPESDFFLKLPSLQVYILHIDL